MKKIVCYTQCLNVEKTLARSIECVLNQTYTNIDYYIIDNNSTDGTRDIISEYAEKDSRIIPIFNEVNDVHTHLRLMPMWLDKYEDTDCLSFLDADDFYDVTAFENMIKALEFKHADICACNSKLVNSHTGEVLGKFHRFPNNTLINKQNYLPLFCEYFNIFTIYWGKLFLFSVLRKCNFDFARTIGAFGTDGAFVFEALKHTENIAVLKDVLHYYIASNESDSKRFNPDRITEHSLSATFETVINYILSLQCLNPINLQRAMNMQMISYIVFIVKEIRTVARQTELSEHEKNQYILRILNHQYVRDWAELILNSGILSDDTRDSVKALLREK